MQEALMFEVDQVGGSFAAQKRRKKEKDEKQILQEAQKFKPIPLLKNHLYLCDSCGYSFWAHWEHEVPPHMDHHCKHSSWLTDRDAIDWIYRQDGVPDWGTPEEIGFELEKHGGFGLTFPWVKTLAPEIAGVAILSLALVFFESAAWETVLPFMLFFWAFRIGRVLVSYTPDTSNDGPMKRSTS